jgi:acetolactate synthase regulatory subunit
MQTFHIRYRNTQGTLLRILNAASRRGLDIPWVKAEPVLQDHEVTLALEVNPKQVGQLFRDWYAIPDVADVRPVEIRLGDLHASAGFHEHDDAGFTWAAPHPPASENSARQRTRTAMA